MTTRNSQVRGEIKWVHVRIQGLCGLMLRRSQGRLLVNTSLGRLLVLFILLSVSSVYGISVSVGRVSYQPEFFDKASVVTPPTMAVAQSHLSSIMSQKNTDSQIQLARAYGKLPLSFEANQGQTDEQVSFLSQGKGYTLFLLRGEAVLALRKPTATEIDQPKDQIDSAGLIARMKLIGANDQTLPAGEEELPGKVNYFLGNDRTKWHMNIATYAKVKYQGVYPGVDLLYYGNQGQLEYDFVIAPGADPKRIILGFEGIKGFEVNEQGNLMLQIPKGQIELHRPLIYQEIDGMRHEISSGYALKNNHQIGFEVGPYDHSKTLVIDPTLVYSTYLGGNGSDIGNAITVDSQGNAYITGATTSTNFPTLNPLQSSSGGVFVTKLAATGSTLMYSTYLGGNGLSNPGNGIAVDSQGNVYITGATNSTNFPTVNPLQSSFGGGLCGKVVLISGKGGDCTDAFVAKLNATGSKLVYSTYLGGDHDDFGTSIIVDGNGNAYVTGGTNSANFPITTGAFQTQTGQSPTSCALCAIHDAFVAKLDATGTKLVYSTYVGGINDDVGYGIAVDASNNAYITGATLSANFPTTTGAFQTSCAGGNNCTGDAFIAKLNPTGSALIYSTLLGGNGVDDARGLRIDPLGNAYITGTTGSTDFPTANAQQSANGGFSDVYVTKLNATGTALIYSTYLGGSGSDYGYAIAIDSSGSAYVTGSTDSTNFPTVNPLQASNSGSADVFVAKLNIDGC